MLLDFVSKSNGKSRLAREVSLVFSNLKAIENTEVSPQASENSVKL